jgi:hypothetical protein
MSFATRAIDASPLRATATTSLRNSIGNAFGMLNILPAKTNPHRLGVNRSLGSPGGPVMRWALEQLSRLPQAGLPEMVGT